MPTRTRKKSRTLEAPWPLPSTKSSVERKRRRRSQTPKRQRRKKKGDGQWGGNEGLSPRRSRRGRKNYEYHTQWGGSEGLSPIVANGEKEDVNCEKRAIAVKVNTTKSFNFCHFLKKILLFFVVVTVIGMFVDDDDAVTIVSPAADGSCVTLDTSPKTCTELVCPKIFVRAKGVRAGASCPGGPVSNKPTCAFSCENENYVLVGHRFIACGRDGQWESWPKCRIADGVAPRPARTFHGTVLPDFDGDGLANRDEIRRALDGVGSEGFLSSIFGKYDADGDGHLDATEYRAAAPSLFGSDIANTAVFGIGSLSFLSVVVWFAHFSGKSSTSNLKKSKRRTVRESMQLKRVPSISAVQCNVVQAPRYGASNVTIPTPTAPPLPCEEEEDEEDPNAGAL